jgi:hypothetical protein
VSSKRDGATVAGVGVAACAVCCAGPILGLLAALGAVSALGLFLFGAFALIAVAIVCAVWYLRRRRRRCTSNVGAVAVAPPSIRTPT